MSFNYDNLGWALPSLFIMWLCWPQVASFLHQAKEWYEAEEEGEEE